MRTYKARLVGAANVIEQHLTKTPCSATIDTTLHMGSCILQENLNHIIAETPLPPLLKAGEGGGGRTFQKLSHLGGKIFARKGG